MPDSVGAALLIKLQPDRALWRRRLCGCSLRHCCRQTGSYNRDQEDTSKDGSKHDVFLFLTIVCLSKIASHRLAVGSGKLELDVIGIAEGEDVDAEIGTQIL